MQTTPTKVSGESTPFEDFERSIDNTFLTLVKHGCVGTHPQDLVVEMLKRLVVEAHDLRGDNDLARRWRST